MLKIVLNMKLIKHIIYIGVILISSCTTLYELDNKQNNVISVSATPDSLITSIINPYKVRIDSVMNEVLCFSSIEMTKGKPESLLGNFVTDLCLEMYDSIADICIMNNGGLRSILPYGDITRGDIYKLMPFDNELVVLELNAEEIYQLSEYIISRGGEPFSGLNIDYFMDSMSIKLLHHRYNEEVIHLNQFDSVSMSLLMCSNEYRQMSRSLLDSYVIRVLTSDYLANGGDKMSFFNNKNQVQVGLKVRDAIINYCKKKKVITSKIDGRLDMISDEK